MKNSIINIKEVKSIFKDDCKQYKIVYTKEKFDDFLKFLEIDFYDWVRENCNEFAKNNK